MPAPTIDPNDLPTGPDEMFGQPVAPSAGSPDGGPFSSVAETGGSRQLPHPETGRPTWFTRASKFAGTLADDYTLTQWKIAMAVYGVCSRRDLYCLGAAFDPSEAEKAEKGWWQPMAELGEKGMDAAQSAAGAHQGTGVHAFTQSVDLGTKQVYNVPPEWREHVRHYLRVHKAAGMELVPEYVERLLLTLQLHNGVSGRADRFRRLPDGRLRVDDLKTGRNAPEGLDEIAVQLAIYANSEWIFNVETQMWERVPADLVDKKVATVTWVPIDRPEAAEVIPIDIETGWEAAKVAAWVRGYRNKAKRKHNGLRLPVDALGVEVARTVPTSDWAERINAATTPAQLWMIWEVAQAQPEGIRAMIYNMCMARRDEIRRAQA